MDEKYIQALYNNLGGQGTFGQFENFKNLISTDPEYRRQFHTQFGEGVLGGFDSFEGLVSVKKKEPVSSSAAADAFVGGVATKSQPSAQPKNTSSASESETKSVWDDELFQPLRKPLVSDQTRVAAREAIPDKVSSFISDTNLTVDRALEGDANALEAVDKMNEKRRVQTNFAQKFYTGEITPEDVRLIKSNRFYSPFDRETPDEDVAALINNKTKNLRSYANAVSAKGANEYIDQWERMDAQIKDDESRLDANIRTNRFEKRNGVWTTPLSEYKGVADEMNRIEQRLNDNRMKRDVLDATFKKNVYDKREQELLDKYLIPKIESDFLGTPITDIYERQRRVSMASEGSKRTVMDVAWGKGKTVPDYLEWDGSGQLSKKSQEYLDRMVDEYVNKIDDPIVKAYEHKSRMDGTVVNTPGGPKSLTNPQISAESLKARLRNHLNYTIPAELKVQQFTDNFLATPEGKKIAPVVEQQSKIMSYFSSDAVRNQESGWKATLDAGYIEINSKFQNQMGQHKAFTDLQQKWLERVERKEISREQAVQQVETEMAAHPELSKLLKQREKEVNALRSRVNREREKFIISGLAGINNQLELHEDGSIGIKGMKPEEVKGIMDTYLKGAENAYKKGLEGQDELLEKYADGRNRAIVKRFGGLLGSFLIGTHVGMDNLGASTSRWLYNKTGAAGDAMHFFDAERSKPYNLGEYANEHFKYKGIESLLDPAYYGFNVGQSVPYAAPATVVALATGGTGGVVLGGLTGGVLEAGQNALNTRDELYLNGVRPNGTKLSSMEADRAAADQFGKEWWVNSLYQMAEFGALMKGALKPSIGKSALNVAVSGIEEAVQEGHQGFIQENAKRRAMGQPELGLFDYLETEDFRQNFFGGLAGGIGQGAPTRALVHLQSVDAWRGMLKNAPQELARNSFFSNAMQQELDGQGGSFRDMLRARIANDDFSNAEEREIAGRTLKYSERLADAVKRERILPTNINGLYAAHSSAMADMYDELANADEGKSSLSKTYKKQADAFRTRAVNALEGSEKIYVINDRLGRPVFVSEQSAKTMDESKAFDRMKEEGAIQGVYSIGDSKFNKEVADRIAGIEVKQQPAPSPAAETQQATAEPTALQEGMRLLMELSEEQKTRLGAYRTVAESQPEVLLKNIADQALGRTETGEVHPDGSQRSQLEEMFSKPVVDAAVQAFPPEEVQGVRVGKTYYPIENDDVGEVLVTSVADGVVNVVFDDKSTGKIKLATFNKFYTDENKIPVAPEEEGAPVAAVNQNIGAAEEAAQGGYTDQTAVNISLISDRIPKYKEMSERYNAAVNAGDMPGAEAVRNELKADLEGRMRELMPGANFEVIPTLGVWDGGFEQSFRVEFENLTPEQEAAMVQIAQDASQEAVHFIRVIGSEDVTRPYGMVDENGSLFTQVVQVEFDENSLTLPQFQELIGQTGLGGGQLSEDGKVATIYNAYYGTERTDPEATAAATDEWRANVVNFVQRIQQYGRPKIRRGVAEFRSYGTTGAVGTRVYEGQDSRNIPTEEPAINPAEVQVVDFSAKNGNKVVDDDGQPIEVYHGTNAPFESFSKDKLGSKNFLAESAQLGFFFAGDPKTSEAYIGINTADVAGLNISGSKHIETVNSKYQAEQDAINEAKNKIWDEEQNKFDEQFTKSGILDILNKDGNLTEKQIQQLKYIDPNWIKWQDAAGKRYEEEGLIKRQEELNEKKMNDLEKLYFADKGLARRIISANVYMANPYVFDYEGKEDDTEGLTGHIRKAKKSGNDGVIFKNLADGGDKDTIYVVFNPEQIKITNKNILEKAAKLSDFFRNMKFDTSDGDVLYSTPLFLLPKALWNTVMEIVASAIDAGVAVAEAIERGVQHARENFKGKEFNEAAVRMVLEGLAKSREEKPVRREGESRAEYAMRVLDWRSRMLKEGTPAQMIDALSGSQTELDYIKKINEGIELLRGNMDMPQQEFNRALGVRAGDESYYIAALKYFKSFSPAAETRLKELRQSNPTRIVATEIQLLKKQLKDFERGYKAGSKERMDAIKAIRTEVATILNEYNEAGYFSGVRYTKDELLRMAGYVNNAITEKGLDLFKGMLNRLIVNAEYGRKLARAKELVRSVRRILKSKESFTANDVPLLRQLTKLNPVKVSQLDRFNEILQDVVDSRKGETGTRIYANRSIEQFMENQKAFDLTELSFAITQKLLDLLDDRYVKALMEHGKLSGLPDHGRLQNIVNAIKDPANPKSFEQKMQELEDINTILDYVGTAGYQAVRTNMNKGERFMEDEFDYNLVPELNYGTLSGQAMAEMEGTSEAGAVRQNLEDTAKAAQEALDTSVDGLSEEQVKALETLQKVDLTGMESGQLRLYINVLNNILLNEDFSGMGFFQIKAASKQAVVDGFLSWLKENNFTVRFKSERSKLGKRFSELKKGLTSTEQVVWRIANNAREMATKIFEVLQLDRIKTGYVKAVRQLKEGVYDKLNEQFTQGLEQDANTNIRLTMYAYLNQNKGTSPEENQAEFSRRIGEIKRDIAVKEQDTNAKNKEEAALVKEVYTDLRTKILDATGVDIDLPVVEGLDNSVLSSIDFISPVQKGAYDTMRTFYDETRPQFQQVMEVLLNKPFEAWENYMPDTFRKLHGGVFDVDIGKGFGNSLFGAEVDPMSESSGAFTERVKGPRVVQPKSGEDLRVINYNFFDGNVRNARAMLMDIHTLEHRMVAGDVMANKDFEQEVGVDNVNLMKETMIKELRGMTGHLGKPQGTELGMFKGVANTLGGIAAKLQLFSFMAYFKQAWSAYANTAAYLGSKWYYVPKALKLIDSNEDVQALLSSQEIALRAHTQAGTNIFGQKNVSEIEGTIGKTDLSDSFQKLSDKINGRNELTGEEKSLMRAFLERGDVVGARTSWIAIYAHHLVTNGKYEDMDAIDWAAEAQNPDRDAAAFAQLQTAKQLNVNSRNAFGSVYTNPNDAMAVLKAMFGLFGNFGFNKSIATINAAQSLFLSSSEGVSKEQRAAEKKEAMRTFVAGMSEEIVFQSVKVLMIKGGLGWLFWTLAGMLAGDDEEKEKFVKTADEQLSKGFKAMPGSVLSNYFFSFAGTNGQEYLNGVMNDLQSAAGVKLVEFYQNTDNPNFKKREGLFNAAFGNTPQDLDRMRKLLFDEQATRKEMLWGTTAILSNVAQMMKVNDADLNRLVQRRVQMLDKDIRQRNGETYWVDMSQMGTRELTFSGRSVELTDDQQKFYKQARNERLKQLEKARFYADPDKDKEAKGRRASEYAKIRLRQQYPDLLKQAKK